MVRVEDPALEWTGQYRYGEEAKLLKQKRAVGPVRMFRHSWFRGGPALALRSVTEPNLRLR